MKKIAWAIVPFLLTVSVTSFAFEIDLSRKMTGPFVVVEGHGSLFSDVSATSITAGSFGYAGRGGYRWSGWGLFGIVEHNMWMSANTVGDKVVMGVVNIGAGFERTYVGGFLSTSVAIGPSVLAFDTVLDDAGTTGLFLHVKPVGFRYPAYKNLFVSFTPLSFATVAPVLGGIPLVYMQYRTTVGAEVAF